MRCAFGVGKSLRSFGETPPTTVHAGAGSGVKRRIRSLRSFHSACEPMFTPYARRTNVYEPDECVRKVNIRSEKWLFEQKCVRFVNIFGFDRPNHSLLPKQSNRNAPAALREIRSDGRNVPCSVLGGSSEPGRYPRTFSPACADGSRSTKLSPDVRSRCRL